MRGRYGYSNGRSNCQTNRVRNRRRTRLGIYCRVDDPTVRVMTSPFTLPQEPGWWIMPLDSEGELAGGSYRVSSSVFRTFFMLVCDVKYTRRGNQGGYEYTAG